MRTIRSVIGLLTLLLCVAAAAAVRAQQPAATLTLEDAVAQGLANSARIAELEARQDSAAAIADGRAAARLPIVAAQGGYTRTNHVEEFAIVQPGAPRLVVYPDVPDNYRARLDVQWLFYTGGRVDALERAAKAERQATGEDLDGGTCRPAPRDHARILDARHRARSRAGAGPFAG